MADGRFVGTTHHFALRVYFEDTDFSGVVYHASYLRFIERARSDMLRCAGIDQRAAFDAGAGVYAVADLRIKYHRPARFDDQLRIESDMIALRGASCVIQQRVIRDDELLAEAEVIAAFVSPQGRPRRQPAAWRAAFARLMKE